MKSSAYKDITLQQLRSFCATARHGSLTGAAAALELAHPTVWKQVHALEQALGTPLVEPHARGCRLTEAGAVLQRLIEPNVANLELRTLQTHFAEALGRLNIQITVAGPSRLLAEDLPRCIAAFVPLWPRARFTLREARGDQVAALVENGEATLGFTAYLESRNEYPQLSFEPWYLLDVILIAPRNHPLARRRQVRLEDLKPYPLVNAWMALHGTHVHGMLVEGGLYQTEPRCVEARQAEIIRACVQHGLGVALVAGLWPQPPHPALHTRCLSRHFGRFTIYLVRRAGVHQHPTVQAFAEAVQQQLGGGRKGADERG